MSRDMATSFVNIILVFFVFGCFSFLDGKQPDIGNQPQEWQDLVSFVNRKIEGMERLLAEKDIIIGKLVKRVSDLETIVMTNPASEEPITRHDATTKTNVTDSRNDFLDQFRSSISNTTIHRDRFLTIRNKPHENQLRKRTMSFNRSRVGKTVDAARRSVGTSSKQSDPIPETSQYSAEEDQPTFQAYQKDNDVDTPIAKLQNRVAPSSPRQAVAFHAERSSDKMFHNNEVIAYDQEKLDQGDGYSPGVGLYIVPESGTYVITWTTVCDQHTILRTVLVVNGSVRGSSWTDAQDITDFHQTTAIVVLTLNKGDHVFIRMGNGSGQILSDSTVARSTISGWKID